MLDAKFILQELRARGMTLATAESCTGGLLGSKLTAVPSSSDVYRGGVISYCNDLKHRLLGVPLELLERCGAVSFEVAEAMACGAKTVGNADIGIGITGLAGPGGDGSGLRVGLVFIGCACGERVTHRRIVVDGTRDEVREEACKVAFELILSLV